MAKANIGPGKEFFSEWHLEAYFEAKQRELLGAKARGDAEAVAECEKELARLGKKTAAKK